MITDILKKDAAKVLAIFSLSPGSRFTRNELKDKTKLNNLNLDSVLNVLLSNSFLIKEKRLLTLNFENESMKDVVGLLKKEYKRLKELPLEVYFLLMDVSQRLSGKKAISSILLFGSYSKLIYTPDSDVDIAFILKKEDKQTVQEAKRELSKLEKKYGKTIEGHFFEEKDMKRKDPLIKEIVKNGVELF